MACVVFVRLSRDKVDMLTHASLISRYAAYA